MRHEETLTTDRRGLGIDAGAWQLPAMSTTTIPLPDEDLTFLRAYTSAQGTSAEEFLAQQARNLREHLQRPLHSAVETASGIIPTGEEAHREHLQAKHG